MIYDGASFYIYEANGAANDKTAIADAASRGLDVFSMSFEYPPTSSTCKSDYDSQLYNFISLPYSFPVAASGNDGFTDKIGYPGSSVFTTSVGAADQGSPWPRSSYSNYGTMWLDSVNCPQQYNTWTGTQWGSAYLAPTVYGDSCIVTDKSRSDCGTSIAAPEISAGMGEIASRCYYKSECGIYHFDLSRYTCGKRSGGWYLASQSNSPDGRGITPGSAWKAGAVADHDAWYVNSWTPTC